MSDEVQEVKSKYDRSLYDVDPNIDDLEEEQLIPEEADLNEGLGPDAYQDYDVDDETLPSDDEDDGVVAETGMEDEDGDYLKQKENLGDVIANPTYTDDDELSPLSTVDSDLTEEGDLSEDVEKELQKIDEDLADHNVDMEDDYLREE